MIKMSRAGARSVTGPCSARVRQTSGRVSTRAPLVARPVPVHEGRFDLGILRSAGLRAVLIGIAPLGLSGAGGGASPDVTEPPPYTQFLVIPLRVHVLQSAD